MKEEDIIYILLLFFPRREREKTLRGFLETESAALEATHTHTSGFSFLFIFHFFYGRQSAMWEREPKKNWDVGNGLRWG